MLKTGLLLLSFFLLMYSVAFVEISMSFTSEGRDGIILTFYKTILGYPWDRAGYSMMLVLTMLLMVGAVFGYYGVKVLRQG